MDAERQQSGYYQPLLFTEWTEELRPGSTGDGGTEAGGCEESQTSAALGQARALPDRLMEEVTRTQNLTEAINRVRANKGSAGVDGMPVDELLPWVRQHLQGFVGAAPCSTGAINRRRSEGCKSRSPAEECDNWAFRRWRIGWCSKRFCKCWNRFWTPPSRLRASAFVWDAGRSPLAKAKEYVAEGRTIVVDMDLEKFFDRVNHDILMARLARHISDKRLLKLIRRFVEAGMMQQGVCVERHEGAPQGGPLSPLLANLLLDDLDKELEARGHCFCRYADDCNIYVRTERGSEKNGCWRR